MKLSIRAYAQHREVSDTAVRKAIKQGRITVLADGKIDPDIADRQWNENTNPSYNPVEEPEKTTISPSPKESIGSSYQQSRAIREAYEARLKKLDFDQKSGKLIPITEVQMEAFNAARLTRDRILSIPDKVIPLIAGKTDIHEMKDILRKELLATLEGLSEIFSGNKSG